MEATLRKNRNGAFSIVGLIFKGRVETPQRVKHHAFIYSLIDRIVKNGTVLGAKDSKRSKTYQGT